MMLYTAGVSFDNRSRRYLLYANQDYSFPILQPIQKAILRNGDQVAWFVHGDAHANLYLQPSDQQFASVDAVMDYNPFAVITPNNTVPYFFPGIKTQVFHGFNARKRSRNGVDSHFTIRGFFDLYCTHGPSTTKIFKQLSNSLRHFMVIETGWPKIDTLIAQSSVRTSDRSGEQSGHQSDGQSDGQLGRQSDGSGHQSGGHRPVVMLTSTFSKNLTCAIHLLPMVKQLVDRNDMDWVVQFHPKMASTVVDAYKAIKADNYQFVETSDVMPWLARADVMVSDTSSILQEFLQLERPVVTFRNRTPGPWLIDIQNPEDLPRAIEQALACPAELIDEIRSHNAQLHPYTDGRSSERVLQAIDTYSTMASKPGRSKPFNLIRKFKMRKELAYWTW